MVITAIRTDNAFIRHDDDGNRVPPTARSDATFFDKNRQTTSILGKTPDFSCWQVGVAFVRRRRRHSRVETN
jgi:hypothetical protein